MKRVIDILISFSYSGVVVLTLALNFAGINFAGTNEFSWFNKDW